MLAIPFCLALSAPPLAFDDEDGLHSAVVTLGDVNGDGVPDFAFGHRPRPFNAGDKPTFAWPRVPREFVVWILSGSDGAVHQTLAGGPDFGVCLASVGDLDGDGLDELVVQIPMLEELRVLRGSDLSTVWTLDVRGLPRPKANLLGPALPEPAAGK